MFRQMSKKKKLIPELRFPEFKNEGEWGVDIVDNLVSTVTPPRKLTSSNYQKSGKFPIIDQSKSFYCGWTNDIDAVIADNLPLIIFGDHTCILKIVNEPFVQGADGIKILKTKSKITPELLYQYLQHNEVRQEDYKRHFSILKKKNVLFPKKESGEQQKIASCLSSLDEVIAAHSQKLDLLKDHKKGLMQNLFPQQGEKVPKLRFKEFEKDGEWEEKSLDEVCKLVRGPFGGELKKEIFVKEGYAVYEQSHAIYSDFSSFRYYIDEDKFSELKRFSVKSGDLIMSCSGTMGKFAIIPQDYKNGVINQALLKLTVKKGYDNLFIKITLETENNQNNLLSQSAGGAIKNVVSVSQIKELRLQIPSINEQQKIASCLSALDELITEQAKKIEQLKQHKKGLMQGLFPKIED